MHTDTVMGAHQHSGSGTATAANAHIAEGADGTAANALRQRHAPARSLPYAEDQLIRLIMQALRDRGYTHAVAALERESLLTVDLVVVEELRAAVLGGDWTRVEQLLPGVVGTSTTSADAATEHVAIAPPATTTTSPSHSELNAALFLVKRQKFLELLERRETKHALVVLRCEITPMASDPVLLHELSRERAQWTGADGGSRADLFDKLQAVIPSSSIVPPHRLETLLEQALDLQKSKCTHHSTAANGVPYSLFADHRCERAEFPRTTVRTLVEHTDEVWYVAYAHSGSYLASASKDSTAIIWDVKTGKMVHCLAGHDDAVSFLAWSPDDRMLVTCSNDNKVLLWSTSDGRLLRTFSRHVDAVTSCAWLPDNQRFVSSSLDKTIYLWNIDGTLLYRWIGARVTDLAIDSAGVKMMAICHEKKIRIYDLVEKSEVCIQEESAITSLALAPDAKTALVNVSSQEIHLWDLIEKKLIATFTGQKQGRFVIRSCFGGRDGGFVVSGSEDGNVYIWNKDQAKLIEVLSGHTGTVNSVCWNPAATGEQTFASASDDGTIRIWGKGPDKKE